MLVELELTFNAPANRKDQQVGAPFSPVTEIVVESLDNENDFFTLRNDGRLFIAVTYPVGYVRLADVPPLVRIAFAIDVSSVSVVK